MFGLLGLIWFLLVGLAAGWIASQIMSSGKPGLLGMMLVGVVGSYLGGVVFSLLGLKAVGFPGTLVSAVVGAVICIALVRKFGPKL